MSYPDILFYESLPIDPTPLVNLVDQRYLQEAVQAALAADLFSLVKEPISAAALAQSAGWDEETTIRLLAVLCHLGCVDRAESGYRSTLLASTYLTRDSFFFYGDKFGDQPEAGSFAHSLLKALRREDIAPTTHEPVWTAERLRQMGVYTLTGYIQNTLSRVDLTSAATLLDLGGGHGFYSVAFAQKYPDLHVTLFDLPAVMDGARPFISETKVGHRIAIRSGNFLHDDIGGGYDAILASNVLHKDKRDLVLPKIYSALSPGGTFILRCRIADGPDNLTTALSKLYWQVWGGRDLYTAAQWEGFVTPYGFTGFTLHGVDDMFATFTAKK